MKEADKIVNIDNLGEDWLNNAFDSFEAIKKMITYLNETYSFDLYNNDEDLQIDKLNNKQAIKETMVVLPLTYTMEKFLKAVILSYDVNSNQNRLMAVKEILNNVKNSSNIKGNFHNILLLTDYINTNIDTHFKNFFANVYVSRRNGYNDELRRGSNVTSNLDDLERIDYATDSFKNAFIDFRYLYEKSDKIESVDLVKLMDYISSIRDVSFYLITRKRVLDCISQFEDFNRVCPNPDSLFARDREYKVSDGVDLLWSIKSSTLSCGGKMNALAEQESWSEEKIYNIQDNIYELNTELGSLIYRKLGHEYKPEFTRSKEENSRNY